MASQPPPSGYPPGYPPQGYPPTGAPPTTGGAPAPGGAPPAGYPPGYPQPGAPQGAPPQGFPPQQGAPQGYPPQMYYGAPQGTAFPPQGGAPPGYYAPQQGVPPQGFPPQQYGMPPQQFAPPVAQPVYAPKAGDTIPCALRNGKLQAYLVSDNDGYVTMNHAEPPQRWVLEFLSPSTCALRSPQGRYLCAESTLGITGSCRANRIERAKWETWTVYRLPSGRFTFESAHQKFLSGEKNGKVRADETRAGVTEEWDVLPA